MASFNTIFLLAALAYFGSQNALAQDCSVQVLMGCISSVDMSAMQPPAGSEAMSPSSEQMQELCKNILTAKDCLTEFLEKCGAQDMLKQQMIEMESAVKMCLPASADNACSMIAALKCTDTMKQTISTDDVKVMCKSFAGYNTCMEPFKKCEDPTFKEALKSMASGMKTTQEMCLHIGGDDCSQADFMECIKEYETIDKTPEKLCEVSGRSTTCINAVLSKCKTDDSRKAGQEIIASYPAMDENCCKYLKEVKACFVDVEKLKKSFSASEADCQDLQQDYICYNSVEGKCDQGPLKAGMDVALQELGTRQNSCQKQGYKVDASAQKSPNSGGSIQSTVVLVLGALVLAMY